MDRFKKALFLMMMIFASKMFGSDYSIVFLHVGRSVPSHALISLKQARQFNEDCDIYFLTDDKNFRKIKNESGKFFTANNIELVNTSTVHKSQLHKDYNKLSRFNKEFMHGFWNLTTERFFYLYDFISNRRLDNVFHLENDCMLYLDLSETSKTLEASKAYLAAPFEYRERCIPCFVYIKNTQAILELIRYILEFTEKIPTHKIDFGGNDMCSLGSYYERFGFERIIPLPTLPKEYSKHYSRRNVESDLKNTTLDFLCQASHMFPTVLFDGAAYGIYFDGNDINVFPDLRKGTINQYSLIDASKMNYFWGHDEKGRRVIFAEFKGKTFKLANLHVHSKLLRKFSSDKKSRARTIRTKDKVILDSYIRR